VSCRTSTEGDLRSFPVLATSEQPQLQRPPAKEEAVARKAGCQVFFEASQRAWWNDCENKSGNIMKENVKVIVKNTFIDNESEDDDAEFKCTGAKTCRARICGPIHKAMCAKDVDQTWQHMQHNAYEETTLLGRIDTANNFLGSVPKIPALSMPPPVFPASVLPADGAFGMQPPSRPEAPQHPSPPADFGQQFFWATLSGPNEMLQQAELQQVGGSLGAPPNQQVMQATGVPIVISEDGPTKHMQPVMVMAMPVINMQARDSPGIAQATAAPTLSVGACATAAAVAAPVVLGLASTAKSKGSQLHGQITEDGQPACQPCAWFHKASGCKSGANCTRCHACPEGEPKLRKKQKIARLRITKAKGIPVVTAPISPASESDSDTSTAMCSSLRAMLGTPERGHKMISPRWADIDPDEEE